MTNSIVRKRSILIDVEEAGPTIGDIHTAVEYQSDPNLALVDLIVALAQLVAREATHAGVVNSAAKKIPRVFMEAATKAYTEKVGEEQMMKEVIEDLLHSTSNVNEQIQKLKDLTHTDCETCEKDCPLAGKPASPGAKSSCSSGTLH